MLSSVRRIASAIIKSITTAAAAPHSSLASASINVHNPATRQLIATISVSTPESVDATVREAKAAFDSGVWSRAPAHHRAKVLSRLSASLEASVGDLAVLESQQTGRALREFKAQLGTYRSAYRKRLVGSSLTF